MRGELSGGLDRQQVTPSHLVSWGAVPLPWHREPVLPKLSSIPGDPRLLQPPILMALQKGVSPAIALAVGPPGCWAVMRDHSGVGRQQDIQDTSFPPQGAAALLVPPSLSWAEGPEALVGSRRVPLGSGGGCCASWQGSAVVAVAPDPKGSLRLAVSCCVKSRKR